MITQVLHCPSGHGSDLVRHGTTPEGQQRYRSRACPERGRTLLLEDTSAGQSPAVKQQSVEMAMHASGLRDTARVLHGSPTTGMKALQKRQQVHQVVLQPLHPEHVAVEICRVDELAQRRGLTSELDAMWSDVGK
jgi:transposase